MEYLKFLKMRQRNLLDFQNTTMLQKYLLNHEIEIYAINPIFLVLECIFFNLLNFNSITKWELNFVFYNV